MRNNANTKLVYFLRGLGIGIVFGTVVISISGKHNETTQVIKQEMTKEEILAKAKEYGYVEGVDSKVDSLLDQNEAKQSEAPVKTAEPIQTAEPTQKPTKAPVKEVEFKIKVGETASSVAKRLAKAGFVDDAEAFKNYLIEQGYATKLIAGKHTITSGSTYKRIAKALCSRS